MPIVVATGYPGTGKTYIPTRIAAEMFKAGLISSIMLSRPNVTSSKSVGYFPGTKNEKMTEWLAPVLGALKEEFSHFTLKGLLHPETGDITMCPLELIKGLSLQNTFMIVDEAEDLTIEEIKKVLTRIGNGSKIVLCGDTDQTDIRQCGLVKLLKMRESDHDLQSVIGHVDFSNPGTIVRSAACKKIILGFERANL